MSPGMTTVFSLLLSSANEIFTVRSLVKVE